MPKAIVIGAGIAGIAIAIRLRARGYDVEVFEANAYPGGKLSEFRQDGFRFDAGPSLFTMPQMVDELFQLMNEDPADHFEYQRQSVGCHYFYEDGTSFNTPGDAHAFALTMAENLKEEPSHIRHYLRKSAEIYRITAPVFLEKSLHKAGTYFCRSGLKGIMGLGKLNLFRTMNAANSKRFRDPRTVQFFNRFATYNGSNPYQAPATLNIIPHLEFGFGTFFPKGGMISITNSLVDLAQRHDVKFNYNTRVSEIVLENGRVTGVRVGDKIHSGDAVVSNMDIFPTYSKLLPDVKMPKKVKHAETSSSAVIFYWGINKEFEQLGLHNIFFSNDYHNEFQTIFSESSVCDDPTVYINITSKLKSDDAPEGCENWFVMVNAPANNGQDWDTLINKTRSNVIRKLSKLLGIDVASLIVSESVLDPRSIEMRTSGHRGALYGTSSNSRLSAFFRHPNFRSSLKNLYFCGGSVHPGGGIPLCLLSAKITTGLIPGIKRKRGSK